MGLVNQIGNLNLGQGVAPLLVRALHILPCLSTVTGHLVCRPLDSCGPARLKVGFAAEYGWQKSFGAMA